MSSTNALASRTACPAEHTMLLGDEEIAGRTLGITCAEHGLLDQMRLHESSQDPSDLIRQFAATTLGSHDRALLLGLLREARPHLGGAGLPAGLEARIDRVLAGATPPPPTV